MVKYKQVYLDYYGLIPEDFIPCEVCSAPSVDIHHLIIKGMGGSRTKDYIENLIAVCRDCHNKCHGSIEFNTKAKEIHKNNL